MRPSLLLTLYLVLNFVSTPCFAQKKQRLIAFSDSSRLSYDSVALSYSGPRGSKFNHRYWFYFSLPTDIGGYFFGLPVPNDLPVSDSINYDVATCYKRDSPQLPVYPYAVSSKSYRDDSSLVLMSGRFHYLKPQPTKSDSHRIVHEYSPEGQLLYAEWTDVVQGQHNRSFRKLFYQGGELTRDSMQFGSLMYVHDYSYNTNGLMDTVRRILPSGMMVSFRYDSLKRESEVSWFGTTARPDSMACFLRTRYAYQGGGTYPRRIETYADEDFFGLRIVSIETISFNKAGMPDTSYYAGYRAFERDWYKTIVYDSLNDPIVIDYHSVDSRRPNFKSGGLSSRERFYYELIPEPVDTSGPADIVDFELFPNPAKGRLVVKAPFAGDLYFYSAAGALAARCPVAKGQSTIDVPASLASGMYLCSYITTAPEKNKVVKLIYLP